MGKPIKITEQNFEEVVLNSDKPVLIDFWAEWCGPCRAIAPIIEDLANEKDGEAVIGKVDVDHNRNIAIQYGIMNIPTLLIFKGGKVVDKQVGLTSKSVLTHKLAAAALV
ncbi:MAG: thioredoxin [Bacteroidia bacterium]|nr:thioredoxin [Bacteroidia bacterium]